MPKIKYTNDVRSFDVLPAGEYPVMLTKWEWTESTGGKTAGSQMLKLRFEHEGQWIFDNLIFAQATEWKISAFLKAFGFNYQEGQDVDVNDAILHSLMSHQAMVQVSVDEYNGQKSNKVKAYLAPNKPADTLTPATPSQPAPAAGPQPTATTALKPADCTTKELATRYWSQELAEFGWEPERVTTALKDAYAKLFAGRKADTLTASDWVVLAQAVDQLVPF